MATRFKVGDKVYRLLDGDGYFEGTGKKVSKDASGTIIYLVDIGGLFGLQKCRASQLRKAKEGEDG